MKKLTLIALFAFLGFFTKAQDYSWRLAYDVSIPLGDMTDYIGETSWRGVSLDNRWTMNDRFSVGVNFGWHVFYEKHENELFMTENVAAYGNQYRYLNLWTAQVNGHYYFGTPGRINPWVGVSVGTSYGIERVDAGFYSLSVKPWSFAVAPQIGIDIPVNVSTDFMLGLRYNYNTNSKVDFNYTYIGIQAGFKFSVF